MLDYYKLLRELQVKISENPCDIQSGIAYGSVCRLDPAPRRSDVDVLVIIKDESISITTSRMLYGTASELYEKYGIKIHLRVRNLYDLEFKRSGIFDCGVTSLLNKLRDSVVLFGESLDDHYVRYLREVKTEEIVANILQRFSDLRYQNRALLSVNCDKHMHSMSLADLSYREGCILYQLAELICYSNGILFTSSKEAIAKASSLYEIEMMRQAESVKSGVSVIDICEFVSLVDDVIKEAVGTIDNSLVKDILKFDIVDSSSVADSPFLKRWKEIAQMAGFMPGTLVVKDSKVVDGILRINRYKL